MFTITQSEKTNHYLIECPAWEAQAVRQFPSRKWNKIKQHWLIPKIKANMQLLQDLIETKPCEVTEDCKIDILDYAYQKPITRVNFPIDHIFTVEPYVYQKTALDYIFVLDRAALFMDMGTGKTKVSLEYMQAKKVKRLIVMCPLAVVPTWIKEIEFHLGDRYQIHTTKERRKPVEDKPQIVLVGIESLSRKSGCYEKVLSFVKAYKHYSIILDEAHLIKTPTSLRTKNIILLGEKATHKLILTGTPVTNNILDMYSLFNFLDPEIIGIGDFWSYKNRYCLYQERRLSHMKSFKELVGYQNVEELMELIKDYIFRCKKSEVLSIPDKVFMSQTLDMPKEMRLSYDLCKKQAVIELNEKQATLDNVLTKTVHLQNICSGYLSHEGQTETIVAVRNNPKIQEFLRVLEGLPEDEQVIVWSKRLLEIDQIKEACEGKYSYVEYNGKVPLSERQTNLELFQNKQVKLFLATPHCGSVGINLTNCRYVVYFSNTFKLIDRLQSEDRCHRHGQVNKVTYIDLIYKNSIDESILEAIKNKQDFSDYIMNGLTGLNPGEIFDKL